MNVIATYKNKCCNEKQTNIVDTKGNIPHKHAGDCNI
jgi:hypothetical protein